MMTLKIGSLCCDIIVLMENSNNILSDSLKTILINNHVGVECSLMEDIIPPQLALHQSPV
jgi:hypothetical protein